MELIDTHCHIHFPDYELDPEQVITDAAADGVTKLICVGCTLPDSQSGVEFASNHQNVWASVGLHPHESVRYVHDHHALQQFRDLAMRPKVIAIGETGLDYYYDHSPRSDQKKLLRFQLDLALELKLPLIFHIRDAFQDFWPIFDEYRDLSGVVHSFTAGRAELEQIMERGLYVGLNGITTFTKKSEQIEAVKALPLQKLLLETDAPYLTPEPFRGTICQPKHVRVTASFLSNLRGESLESLAAASSRNARELFKI